MNTKLLRRVKAAILAEPLRLDMEIPFTTARSGGPPCGTVACIGGWTMLLSQRKGREKFATTCDRLSKVLDDRGRHHWLAIEPKARKLLGLTKEQAETLFHVDNWPEPFKTRHEEALTEGQAAKSAAQRIEHLIATGE